MRKVYTYIIVLFVVVFLLAGCSFDKDIGNTDKGSQNHRVNENANDESVDPDGKTLQERFKTPKGFERVKVAEGSFADYLRNLPLKPHGSKVEYYNKKIKTRDVYEAVIDMEIGERDLQQCADAVIRLRAEYLYHKRLCDEISFTFTNGFKADYTKWMQGKRIVVKGNNAYWVEGAGPTNDYASFRKYLDTVFAYAGTLSLSQEMGKVQLDDMEIGNVFLQGGSPGHCVIVVDIAENKDTGDKLFMLAQSYMPAQDIHILKNLKQNKLSPWYPMEFGDVLETPEWHFSKHDLARFPGD